MTDIQLEVGKTYLRATAEHTSKILGSFDLVKILGTVDEDTHEYARGYRFFGDDRQWYLGNGGKNRASRESRDNGSWNGEPTWNDKRDRRSGAAGNFHLVREAIASDFSQGFTEKLWVSPEQRLDISKYIPISDPKFSFMMGGVYVDRRGFVHLINVISHTEDRDHVRFRSDAKGSYLSNGRVMDKRSSMMDIAFQRI